MYSFVIDHEKEMKIQLLNAVVLRGLGLPFEQMREDKAPSTSIRIFLNLQIFLCGFKNFPINAYPYPNQICSSTRILIHSSTQDSFGNFGNRACVVKRTKFASRIMAESAQISKKNAKIKVDFSTGNRDNPGMGLPS